MARPSLAADLEIGHTIRTARKKLGILQGEVALAVGISIRTLRHYEAGEMSIPADRRPLFAKALRLRRPDLGFVEPDPPAPPIAPPPALAPDEAAWLALYHRLPSWVRALFRRRHAASVTAPAQEHAPC